MERWTGNGEKDLSVAKPLQINRKSIAIHYKKGGTKL